MLKALLYHALCFVGAATASPAQAQVTPPSGFKLTSVTFTGTGCPEGSMFSVVGANKTTLTTYFSQFFPEVGPGVPISSNRRQCQISFGLLIPEGFGFAIGDVDYSGFYYLDTNVTLAHRSAYYFAGRVEQAQAGSNVTGPLWAEPYTSRAWFHPTLVSSCGPKNETLETDTQIRMSNAGNPKGWGGPPDETWEDTFSMTFHLAWAECT